SGSTLQLCTDYISSAPESSVLGGTGPAPSRKRISSYYGSFPCAWKSNGDVVEVMLIQRRRSLETLDPAPPAKAKGLSSGRQLLADERSIVRAERGCSS